MKKKCLLLLMAAMLISVLSGCFRSVDELFALPKLPEEYQNLQTKIEEITRAGAEYSAPLRGANNQPVQLQDLDGDGIMEAIAFFKVSGGEENKPTLRIYIFRQTGDGYEVGAVISGEGSAIYSIDYENLNDSPSKELVVSWLVGGNAYTLSAYSIEHYEINELMHSSYSNSFELQDLDMDNRKEIVLLRLDTIEGKNRVEFWNAEKNDLVMSSAPMLSQGVTGVVLENGVQKGFLRGETPVPALFVTSYQGDGILTDIFACRNGALENITLEQTGAEGGDGVGVSYRTKRTKDDAKSIDINDDSVLELPMPVPMPSNDRSATAEVFYTWFQYDLNGRAWPVFTTYHNFEDSWYFVLPESWEGRVDVSQYTSIGEKATVFSLWQGDGEESLPFLTIYKLTGPNRHMRARMNGRFTLASDENTIYSAELTGGWDCGLDQNGVLEQFRQSRSEWS